MNDDFDLLDEFSTFLDYSVWGNRSDLTLNDGLKAADAFALSDDLKERKDKILTNSTNEIYSLFQEFKGKDNLRIDIILDNVGLELVSDLCFIKMLNQTKLISPNTTIRWFVKKIPWFISDVTSTDFVNQLEHFNFQVFSEDIKKEMLYNWNRLINTNKWQIKAHSFFTTPYEYYKMKRVSPDLYDDLAQSDLVIFKGDLNYIKLLGNLLWPPKTPFDVAIQEFKPTNLITLRSAKYNLVVDLKDEQIPNNLPEQWYSNGEYAMISMYKKR